MAGEYINDEVRDQGLDWATANGSRIDICSSAPTTYAQATSTYTLGNKTGLTVGAAEDGDTDGRKVVVPAITDGSVTSNGTAAYWALTDGASLLIAAGPLSASKAVLSGSMFTLDAINITQRDATVT